MRSPRNGREEDRAVPAELEQLPSTEHKLGTWLQEVRCQRWGDTFSTLIFLLLKPQKTKVHYTAAVSALKVSLKPRRKNMKSSSVDLLPPAPIW